ncbi:hypothetical protein [Aquimarina algiphila]|uniref:Uncharacterized protein n=2 Tax=Aquimarina algiphila TaxID=2047982 RepID=A0A554VA98_9FLAO|nr:hypothetical protein [Aquimarina algiphila]TSE02805.1 hypothetical protein FOF46_30445 [Aquimarina algiphila]
MKLLDNYSRLNNMIVSQGLRVATGDSASLYMLYKKLEKRVKMHSKKLLAQYSIDNCNDTITKSQWNKVKRYLEVTEHKCITRLDAIKSISKMKEYIAIEDTNTLIYEVTGRNVAIRIQTLISK